MENISPELNSVDALLLYSIAYCQRHNYRITLGRIFLTIDAINRSFPTVKELEDGLSRLIVGRYIEIQQEIFIATNASIHLFNEITKKRNTKLNILEQIKDLTDRLNASPLKSVEKQLMITNAQISEATQEAHALFVEINKNADEILKARKTNETS